jgi:hypothetical protein
VFYINDPYSSALARACARVARDRERAELRAIASELTIFSRAQESMFRIADHYERKAVRLRNDLE